MAVLIKYGDFAYIFGGDLTGGDDPDCTDREGVDSADVSSLTVRRQVQSNRGRSRVTGFEAWVRLRSCEGALIIEFTRDCRQRQAYTRGKCEISGLSAY